MVTLSIQPPFTKALKSSPGRTSGFMYSRRSPELSVGDTSAVASGGATVSVTSGEVLSCPQAASAITRLAVSFFTIDYLSGNAASLGLEWGLLTREARDCSRIVAGSQVGSARRRICRSGPVSGNRWLMPECRFIYTNKTVSYCAILTNFLIIAGTLRGYGQEPGPHEGRAG